jgi:NAD(P)-dependent dehydrogenase (short-subunit alcohol dehydrogenase family)
MGLARMQDKSVVVSGAAFGIGRATAAKFAEEGASLLIQDIQGRPLLAFRDELRRKGATVEAVVGDVSQVEDCKAMIRAAVETYGRVDVVVANAGIIALGDVLESTVDDWNKVMAIDGRGMFLTCKYAIEAMLKTGGGSIVCLSSISGIAGQNRQATYGPAKFLATGITKHLAIEWAYRGIRVNAVAPGTINPSASNVCRRSRAVPNTSKRLRRPIQWDDSASLKRLQTRFSSWRQTRHHSSLAQLSQSMAGTWLSKPYKVLGSVNPLPF